MKSKWLIVFKKMSGNHFAIQGHFDLDLSPTDPKLDRGHLLFMFNLHVKYEDFVIHVNGIEDNQHKLFSLPTDRATLAKQYTPSSSKGGIKYVKRTKNYQMSDVIIYVFYYLLE